MIIPIRPHAWLARDKSGFLYLYDKKPEKGTKYWLSNGFRQMWRDHNDFPQVKWEDPEPTEVEIYYEEDK